MRVQLVRARKAVIKRTRPPATQIVGAERRLDSSCRCVSKWHPDYAEETVSQRSGANCGHAEGPMEKAGVPTPNRWSESPSHSHHVHIGPQEDCCGATGEVGKGEGEKEVCLARCGDSREPSAKPPGPFTPEPATDSRTSPSCLERNCSTRVILRISPG